MNQGTTNSCQAGSQVVAGNTDGRDSGQDNGANNSYGNIGDDAIDTANLGNTNISANGGTNGSNDIMA